MSIRKLFYRPVPFFRAIRFSHQDSASPQHVYPGSWTSKKQPCPFCGGNFATLNTHISKAHGKAISDALRKKPLETYTAIFGRNSIKNINSNEIRYPDGLIVKLEGLEAGLWYSFTDNVGGGPIKAIRYVNNDLSYLEAILKAARLAGWNVGERGRFQPISDEEARMKTEEIKTIMEQSRNNNVKVAQGLWRLSAGIKDTLAQEYLCGHRKIPFEIIDRLKFRFLASGITYTDYDTVGTRIRKKNESPCLVVPVEDTLETVTGVQRIFLDAETGGKVNYQNSKFSRGIVKHSAGIVQKGEPFNGDIVIAEGPETAASLAAVCPAETTVIASLSLSNLPNLADYVLHKSPKKVIVAGDNDKSKPELREKFEKMLVQFEANVREKNPKRFRLIKVLPDIPQGMTDADWNDVLRERRIGHLKLEFWTKVKNALSS